MPSSQHAVPKPRKWTPLEDVKVADMEPAEAIELFCKCTQMTNAQEDVEMEVQSIVTELGNLALAITLAGSYISQTPRLSSDIRQYLPEYRQRQKQLLGRKAEKYIHQYGESVLSTWETSFSAVAKQSLLASRLLSLLAFLNFDDIFLELFDHDTKNITQHAESPIHRSRKLSGILRPVVALRSVRLRQRLLRSRFGPGISLPQWRSFFSPDAPFDRYALRISFCRAPNIFAGPIQA